MALFCGIVSAFATGLYGAIVGLLGLEDHALFDASRSAGIRTGDGLLYFACFFAGCFLIRSLLDFLRQYRIDRTTNPSLGGARRS